jgi:hypothetical protein
MAAVARAAEREVPPITLAGLEGWTRGWTGSRCAWFEGTDGTRLRRALDETADALAVAPPGAAWLLRRWWFRGARALCAWLAADPDEDRRAEWTEVAERACALGREAPGGSMDRWATNQLAVLRRLAGDHDGALALLTRALPTRGNWADPQVHTDLGLVHLARGDLAPAIRHLERARSHRSRPDQAGTAVTDAALALAYRARAAPGDPTRAHTHLTAAARRLQALGEPDLAAALRKTKVRG